MDCIFNIPDTLHHVSIPDATCCHNVIWGTASKVAKCTSEAYRWCDWAIGSIPPVVVADYSRGASIPSFLHVQRLDDTTSKLLCKTFERTIQHLVCSFEKGKSKLLIYVSQLVSCTLVCTSCSKSWDTMMLSFLLALLSHLWCCQSERLDCNTYATGSGTHRGLNSCRRRRVSREAVLFVLVWVEIRASGWKRSVTQVQTLKDFNFKLQCFVLPFNNGRGWQKNWTFII